MIIDPDILAAMENAIDNEIVYLHFYNPIGIGDWYATSLCRNGSDLIFKGVVMMSKCTWQDFTLNELRQMILPFGEKIKIDQSFTPIAVEELEHFLKNHASVDP